MAAISLPMPGTEYGPCETSCSHCDCAATRRMAATVCPLCNGPIAYNLRFFNHSTTEDLVHAICLAHAIDEKRKTHTAGGQP